MNSLRIVSWNVNSIAARLERAVAYLARAKPDVVLLQEIKCTNDKFPEEAVRAVGYEHQAVFGQKTYNGVAILSMHPLQKVQCGLNDDIDDPQARVIKAEVKGITVMDVYVPNGQARGSEKFAYKLQWLDRLRRHLDKNVSQGAPFLIAGDFNIAPEERDVHDPAVYQNSILFTPEEREALHKVKTFGLVDTFRQHHEEAGKYSWWDYRQLAFPKNLGLRIDHIYTTPPLAARCLASGIDRDERKGEKPSDHAPVWAEFSC